MPGLLLVLLSALLLGLFVFVYKYILHPYWLYRLLRRQGVRGPPFRPLVGQLPELAKCLREGEPFRISTELHGEFGSLFFMGLGPVARLTTTEPEIVKLITQTEASSFEKSTLIRQNLGSLLGRGLLLSEGAYWQRQRKLLNPAFHFNSLRAMVPLMGAAVVDALKSGALEKTDTDMHEFMSRVALDVITRAMFGGSGLDPSDAHKVYELMEEVQDVTQARLRSGVVFFPWLAAIPTRSARRRRALEDELRQMVLALVEARRAGTTRSVHAEHDLLDLLLKARDETSEGGDGLGMSDLALVDELLTFFLAGHETTGNTLTWSMYELSKEANRELLERVRAEAVRVLGAGGEARVPDTKMLGELTLLDAFVSEVLRLHPVAPFFSRSVSEDVTLEWRQPEDDALLHPPRRLHVKRGTDFNVNVYILHRRRDLWGADAEVFRPDRWLDRDAPRRHPYQYVPFGAGVRNCIGQNMARLEVKTVLSMLLVAVPELAMLPGQKVGPEVRITLRPRYPMYYNVRVNHGVVDAFAASLHAERQKV
jgi:cytochrome P450